MENTHQFLSLSKVPLILTSIVTNLQILGTAVHSSTNLSDDVNPVGTWIPVPEFIDPVFAKTSPKRSFSITKNERFGLYKFGH
jgi:hypothetical protein